MTTKYRVEYWRSDPELVEDFDIEILRYTDESTPMTKVAAIQEARVQILEKLGYDFKVTEIKP